MPADENVRVIRRFFVSNAVAISYVARQLARLEVPFTKLARKPNQNHYFRRWIAITAGPKGIGPGNRRWQSIVWSIKVNCACFAVIASQDGDTGSVRRSQRIPNPDDGLDQL